MMSALALAVLMAQVTYTDAPQSGIASTRQVNQQASDASPGLTNFGSDTLGTTTPACGNYGTLSGGRDNQLFCGDGVVIAGGHNNYVNDHAATVGGGRYNSAEGEATVVAGGESNFAFGDGCAVMSGVRNKLIGPINGCRGVIGGGVDNQSRGTNPGDQGGNRVVIAGGDSNLIQQDVGGDVTWSTIGGGAINRIRNVQRGTIAGGRNNIIETPGTFAVFNGGAICGGSSNQVRDDHGAIAGGSGNKAGRYSFVGGGLDNDATGTMVALGGGIYNTATAEHSTIAGGLSNVSTGTRGSIGGGDRNRTDGAYSTVPGGLLCVAEGDYSTAMGIKAVATRTGEHATSGGAFAVSGDAQRSHMQLRGTAPGVTIELDAQAGGKLTVAEGRILRLRVQVVADGGGKSASGQWVALVRRVTGAPVLLTGNISSAFTEDPEATGWMVSIDGVGDRVRILFDPGSDTARALAFVEIVEIAGG